MDPVPLTIEKFGDCLAVVSTVVIKNKNRASGILYLGMDFGLEPIQKICLIGGLCEAIIETLLGRREGTDNGDSGSPVGVTGDN